MTTATTGTVALLRTLIRQDGRRFAPWVMIVMALSASSVLAYAWIFPNMADRTGLATAIGSNPAIGVIFGPAFDLTTSDGFNAWRSLALGGFLTALGTILTVTHSTRGQEDSGQAELLASGVLGRASRLLAGVGLALGGSLLLGVVVGLVTVLCGGGWESSLILAATFIGSGWMFTGIAAITAQLGSDARTANSLAVGTLGTLFLLRGFAYAIDTPAWTIWANPLGWMTEIRPASGNYWWPFLLVIPFTGVSLAIAFMLHARRDFGQGAIAPRPGPARGVIRTPWRLALRVNRGPLISWTIAFAIFGLVFGSFAAAIHDLLGKDSAVSAILASGATTPAELTSAFLVTILSIVGILASVPGVQIMLKVRSEELSDRVAPLLAGAVGRTRYFAAQIWLACLAPAVFTLLAGVSVAVLASNAGIGVDFNEMMLQAAATVPAVWTTIAVSVAVIGIKPQFALAAWAGVLASFALTLLGPTFKLWDWALAFSPFWHVPNVGAADPAWFGLVWISVVTALLIVMGCIGFHRRDIEA